MLKNINYINILNNFSLQKIINKLADQDFNYDNISWVRGLTNCSKAEEIFNLYFAEKYCYDIEDLLNKLADEILDKKYNLAEYLVNKKNNFNGYKTKEVQELLIKWIEDKNKVLYELKQIINIKTGYYLNCFKLKNEEKLETKCSNCEAKKLILEDLYDLLKEVINWWKK